MPVRPLTDVERARLTGFPQELAEEELFSHFALTGPDRRLVPSRAAPAVRLGFALALCAVRYLGFCPDDLASAPESVLWYVGQQVDAPPEAIEPYGLLRGQTRSDHLKLIHDHLGYRRPAEGDLEALSAWLLHRALEHDDQALLVSLAAEWLKAKKLVRPALYRLERAASSARERAVGETHRALSHVLTPERTAQLDRLLLPVPQGGSPDGVPRSVAKRGQTPLSWLKYRATSNTPKAIKDQIAKLSYLRGVGADRLDASSVNPNRLKLLAAAGRRYTNQALQRQPEERRRPVLVAVLKEAHTETTDEVLDLFDQCLWEADRRSRNELAEFRRRAAKATDEKVRLFNGIARLLLDPDLPHEELRTRAFALAGSDEDLREALRESERLMRPLDDNYYDFFVSKYNHVRQFAPAVLGALEFRSNKTRDPLLNAVFHLKKLNDKKSRKAPSEEHLGFVPAGWLPYVRTVLPSGRRTVDRRHWEMCLLWELRGALRSGDVWVEGARRYADPQSFLIPEAEWPALRREMRLLTGTPTNGAEHLSACREEMEGTMRRLEATVARGGKVRIQQGKLVFSRDDHEGPPESARALGREVSKRLPKVELTDLVVEVDRWTHFLSRLTHAAGSEPRTSDLRRHLHAAILAQATNIGPVRMADLADLSYDRLAWAYTWYLREDTLKDAIAQVVNFHHSLPLSSAWGGGTLSSSDGQRFPVDVKAKNARMIPKYFGYGKGVTFYSWTSDQFSQYGAKVIPSTVRDATYVLDGILGNETDLAIAEHTVDTHGFTESVFALFAGLGLRFSPRIKDIADQVLYGLALGARDEASVLRGGLARSLLSKRIDEGLVLRHWDDIQRVVGSLKLGWVTASLFVGRLEAKPRKSGLAKAIQEYGRLQKTLFLLRYAESDDLRRRIGRQLNKGEDLHALRRFLFFAGEGKMRRRDPEEQGEQALCSNLLTDAVVAWNTVYAQEALTALREDGFPVRGRDLAHLSPTLHEHINPYGRYHFDPAGGLPDGGLRPLRRA